MRRKACVLAVLSLAWLLALSAPAGAAQGQMHVKIPGFGSFDLDGVSTWDPASGTASWCSQDACGEIAALLLPQGDAAGTPMGDGEVLYETGGDAAFTFASTVNNLSAASVAGECDITVYERTTSAVVGGVKCRDLPSTRGMLTLGARFRAEATSQPAGQVPGIAAPPEGEIPSGTERIRDYRVEISIRPDGVLDVTERIDYDFGAYAVDRHGIYRDIPNRFYHDEERDRVMPIEVTSVEATGGASADYEVEDLGDGQIRIKVGDADRTVEGRHTYTLHYTVEGALNPFPDHDELYWNAIGANWSVPIRPSVVEVRVPDASGISGVACYVGSAGSTEACGSAQTSPTGATYRSRALGPYEGLTVVAALDKSMVTPEPAPILVERWSFQRAFALTPATGSASGGLLALAIGAFAFLVWRNGRDKRYAGGPVAATMGAEGMPEEAVPLFEGGEMPVEFAPPEDIRPGQVGTLIDEVANPLDVSATIVDLAVRGYLTIEEIPKEGLFGKPDWRLTRATAPPRLLEYERRLYDGLFAEADGDSVLLSELKTKFVDRLHSVQESLYEDAVRRKWFTTDPKRIRERWHLGGWLLAILGGGLVYVLARWTHWGLVGVPFVLAGLLFAVGARWMPRRTAKGTAMVRRVKGFRRFVESPTQTGIAQMSERENLFSQYLPYAVVFGCTEKWARAFQALGLAPAESSWFIAARPMAYADLGEAFGSFATVASGTVAATPASSGSSGFGGGAGGGGGGGGGGSW